MSDEERKELDELDDGIEALAAVIGLKLRSREECRDEYREHLESRGND